jgi:phage gp37-like protein
VATTITRDQVLDAMVAQLAPLKPAVGGAVSPTKYVRDIARYAGEFSTQQALLRGMAGRTPAVLLAFSGERTISTTIGRKVDKVEGTYVAVCCSDSERSRDDRASVFRLMNDVRGLLGARRLGLAMHPLRYVGDQLILDDEQTLAYGVRFTTRYRVDFTKPASYDALLSTDGAFKFPTAQGGATVVGSKQTLEGP